MTVIVRWFIRFILYQDYYGTIYTIFSLERVGLIITKIKKNLLIETLKGENVCILFTIAKLHEELSKWPTPRRHLAKSRDFSRP